MRGIVQVISFGERNILKTNRGNKIKDLPITAYKTQPPIFIYQTLTYYDGEFRTYWLVFNLN